MSLHKTAGWMDGWLDMILAVSQPFELHVDANQ
jgi:hypothetical protein